jgi:hypothetical protein
MVSTRRVSEHEIRKAFNASGLYERSQEGSILVTEDDGVPGAEYHQPPGTVSRTTIYTEAVNGQLIRRAVLHSFVLPDGTINNRARRPDPKYLRIGDEILLLERKPKARPVPRKPPPGIGGRGPVAP